MIRQAKNVSNAMMVSFLRTTDAKSPTAYAKPKKMVLVFLVIVDINWKTGNAVERSIPPVKTANNMIQRIKYVRFVLIVIIKIRGMSARLFLIHVIPTIVVMGTVRLVTPDINLSMVNASW